MDSYLVVKNNPRGNNLSPEAIMGVLHVDEGLLPDIERDQSQEIYGSIFCNLHIEYGEQHFLLGVIGKFTTA